MQRHFWTTRLRRAVPIVAALLLAAGAPAVGEPSESYVCPPCNCGNDQTSFAESGACPVCQMALVRGRAPSTDPVESTPATIGRLEGRWAARLEHNGQHESMAIEFVRGPRDDARLVARLTLPALDLRGLAVGYVKIDGDTVTAGPFQLRWNSADGSLRGVLPEAFVPVYTIPFALRRSEPDGPLVAEGSRRAVVSATPNWTRNIGGAVWAGLELVGDRVLIGSDDGKVTALEASDGSTAWQFETEARIRARPTAAGEAALVHSDDGHLYALSVDDGRERWRARLGPPSGRKALSEPDSRYEHYASAAVVDGSNVYVANTEGALFRLSLEDGTVTWRFDARDSISSTPAVAGGRVFVASFDHHVYAVEAASGSVLWQNNTGQPLAASPVVSGDLVLVGGRSYDFLALRANSGEQAWSRYFWFSWVEASAAVGDDVAYVALSDGQQLSALRVPTGEVVWSFDTNGSVWAQPALTESTVYVGAVGVPGYFVEHRAGLFAVDRDSGRESWRYEPDAASRTAAYGFAAAPVVGPRQLFAATLDGEVLAFDR